MPRFRGTARAGAVTAALVVVLTSTAGVEAAFETTTGNTGNTLTAAATFPRYAAAVAADSPSLDYRLNEAPSAGSAADAAGGLPGAYATPYAFGIYGATGDGDHALQLRTGTSTEANVRSEWVSDPQVFTEEVWFRTTTTSGGKIIGFGTDPTGNSGGYDRHVYMLDDGTLTFGIYPGSPVTLTTTDPYNDGQWHLVDASVGPSGMELYVDGALVGSDSGQTEAQHFDGYWRVGGDNLSGWPGEPSSYDFNGAVDEVAVYPTQLTGTRIAAHHDAAASGYAAAVLADTPDLYWRLGDSPGTVAADASGNGHTGTINGGPWVGPAAVAGATSDGDGAAHFTGEGSIVSSAPEDNPSTFSAEVWFRTTTTSGGKLIGFGDHQAGESSNYDRHVYLSDDGTVYFGVNPSSGWSTIASGSGYNDGAWHQVVATDGASGMHLYVDGAEVASDGATSGGQDFTGYWRVGGDNVGGWPGEPSTHFFTGDIDDVAVYSTELTAAQVGAHYTAASGGSYAAGVLADSPELYWRLDDASLASRAADSSSHGDDGLVVGLNAPFVSVSGPMRAGQPATTAVHFAGSSNLFAPQAITSPQVFTLECWFRTTTATGGKIMGFGDSPTGSSYDNDRHVYMTDDGRLVFGVYPWYVTTVATTQTYNDGAWHQVDATFGAAGIKLYVDGRLQAADPSITSLYSYTGYWRLGGDTTASWPDQPSSDYFIGDLAEFAVYPTQLTDDQVRVHYYANH